MACRPRRGAGHGLAPGAHVLSAGVPDVAPPASAGPWQRPSEPAPRGHPPPASAACPSSPRASLSEAVGVGPRPHPPGWWQVAPETERMRHRASGPRSRSCPSGRVSCPVSLCPWDTLQGERPCSCGRRSDRRLREGRGLEGRRGRRREKRLWPWPQGGARPSEEREPCVRSAGLWDPTGPERRYRCPPALASHRDVMGHTWPWSGRHGEVDGVGWGLAGRPPGRQRPVGPMQAGRPWAEAVCVGLRGPCRTVPFPWGPVGSQRALAELSGRLGRSRAGVHACERPPSTSQRGHATATRQARCLASGPPPVGALTVASRRPSRRSLC